ncbi:hypothetical protein quinque_012600 [Culex quinquefasciatus]
MQLEPDVEDGWRHLENALAMVRKLAEKQVPSFVPLVLQMISGLDDDEEIEDGPAGQRRGAGQCEQQNFGSRTAGLEDKASACKMLICYARELKNGFANHDEKVVRVMMPMFKFYFYYRVRTTASESLDDPAEVVTCRANQQRARIF